MLTGNVRRNFQNLRYFSGWKVDKSKPTRKLKHANSILEYFEYFCQMSSKSFLIILSYTISNLTRFFWDTVYTSLKSTFSAQQFPRWQCGSIFIRLAVVASQTCQLVQNSENIWTYSSWRSSKVDDFGTNWKRIYEFLWVINSNFGPILYRFWDTATYWLKTAYFSHSHLIRCPRSLCSLWNFAVKLSIRKLESWGYSVVKVAWS